MWKKGVFSILDPISHMCSYFFTALSITHKSNNCSLKLASRWNVPANLYSWTRTEYKPFISTHWLNQLCPLVQFHVFHYWNKVCNSPRRYPGQNDRGCCPAFYLSCLLKTLKFWDWDVKSTSKFSNIFAISFSDDIQSEANIV